MNRPFPDPVIEHNVERPKMKKPWIRDKSESPRFLWEQLILQMKVGDSFVVSCFDAVVASTYFRGLGIKYQTHRIEGLPRKTRVWRIS